MVALATSAFAAEKKAVKKAVALPQASLTATAPDVGSYTTEGAGGGLIILVDKKTSSIKVSVPVAEEQTKTVGEMKLFASYALLENGAWVVKGFKSLDDHSLVSKTEGDRVSANVKLTDAMKASSHVWFRFWGQNKAGDWLLIMQTQFTKEDKAGKPGYEVILDTKSYGIAAVPVKYDKRP